MQVAGETIDEPTLTEVLMNVLADSSRDGSSAVNGVIGTQKVAAGEVEAAARYIIRRFGKSARKVAQQALREVSIRLYPWW